MSAEEKTYGQILREKGIGVKFVPGGNRMMKGEPSKAQPDWTRTTKLTDKRPGGGEVPVLDENLKPVNLKRYYENRQDIDARRGR